MGTLTPHDCPLTLAPHHGPQDQTRRNRKSHFLEFQGEFVLFWHQITVKSQYKVENS